ncbi:hypothetical protein [Coleofasciculus sp. F4-SAH-05]|uniref:hypothetical protein n=1 Tax=Coleofasciculus sp. F4-SAH-05 TaxID=3069525 RepID=UPI0032FF1BBC
MTNPAPPSLLSLTVAPARVLRGIQALAQSGDAIAPNPFAQIGLLFPPISCSKRHDILSV